MPAVYQQRAPKELRGSNQNLAISNHSTKANAWLWLLGLCAAFLIIEFLVPLGTAAKLGADEDFEFSKTLLYLKGFKFYSEVWNDEPPLYPYLLAQIANHIAFPLFAMRFLTVCFSLILTISLFTLCLKLNNVRTAILAMVALILSPGFIDLSSSCMVEIPSVALVVAAFAVLCWPEKGRAYWMEAGSGILFGIALQMKVIAVIYLPLTLLLLWLKHRYSLKRMILSGLVIGAMTGVSFVSLNALTGCPFWPQVQQALTAHFSKTKSFEYGSPSARAFDWFILLKNWDTFLPVILGLGYLLTRKSLLSSVLFPWAWLVLTIAIVSTHKPWWSNYYLHNAVPMCWCAAIAIDQSCVRANKAKVRAALLAIFLLAAGGWMATRGYLQITSMRSAPRVFSSMLLSEIERYKPYAQFMYSTEPVYCFHAGIPLPPELANISLKRLWSGDMTNSKMVSELSRIKPGLVMIGNVTNELPYSGLLQTDYKMVYQDERHQLYALKSIAEKVNQ